MRPSILPNLLAAAQRNADRGFPDGALFEIGPLYRDDTPEGQDLVAAGRARPAAPARSAGTIPAGAVDALLAKADALAALAAAGAPADNLQIDGRPARLVSSRPRRHACGSARSVLGAFRRAASRRARARSMSPAAGRGFEVFLDAVPPPRARARRGRCCKLRRSSRSSAISPLSSIATLPAETLLRAARGVDRKLVTESACSTSTKARASPEARNRSRSLSCCSRRSDPDRRGDRGLLAKLVAAVEKATGGTLRR